MFKITVAIYFWLFYYVLCCNAQNNTFSVSRLNTKAEKNVSHIASLDANNKHTSKLNNFRISLIDKNETDYLLSVYSKDNRLIYKNICQGISKIYEDSIGVYFVEYSLFTEDGHTEGKIITLDSFKQNILKSKNSYSNCTNPFRLNDKLYVISDMKLLQLNRHLDIESRMKIYLYKSHKVVNTSYADTYLFCDIDNKNNEISINFTPDRTKLSCKIYTGQLNINSSHINIIFN